MARCRIVDLRHKQVVNVKDGTCLGCVDDMEIDMATAKLVSIIIYGRLKWFGLLGRCDDICIKWEDIQVIGEDTILVCYQQFQQQPKKRRFFNRNTLKVLSGFDEFFLAIPCRL